MALFEPILPDDAPVNGEFIYICDGQLYRNPHWAITVGELKRREGFKEVRRCDSIGRFASPL